MTSKDKPRRPGGKPPERDGKPARKFAKPAATAAPKPAKGRAITAAESTDGAKPERISKIMARAGVASRRDIERMILEGRVALNGKVLDTPVVNATLADKIEVDGVPIRGIERTRLWLYHKPAGLVTTNADPEGRPTVFDNLPEELPRVMSIGRLDINTEGLLLLTNDGGLSRVLELPTTGWLRRYRVRAHGEVDQAALDKLKDGIAVDGVLYGSIDATLDRSQGHNVWITMGLREGKNREIKNVLGALGLEVNRLIRISYGPFQLGDLPEGKVVEVRGRMLRDQLGPRLIEEAKANFDAPIYGATVTEDGEAEKPSAPKAAEKPAWGKRDKPEDKRERALGRLDTRRDSGERGAKPAFKRGDKFERTEEDRPKRKAPLGQSRTANVWMAPGARPVAEKQAGAKDAEGGQKRTPRPRPEGAPQTKRYGRDKDGVALKSKGRLDQDRRGGPGAERPDAGPRVMVSRMRDEEGEWIRAEGPDRSARDNDRGGKRGFGDRPPRGEGAPRGDRPQRGEGASRGDRPARADGPRSERAFGDKPRGDRAFGDKPRGERSFGDKPRGPKPFGDKPRGEKPYGGKPSGGKSFGSKSAGERSYGDKPAGKSFGGKPSGGKPAGGKPRGDRPDGNGPRGGSGRPGGMTRGADRRR
ncbi:pseudouridine synthase [Rhizobium sp. RU36D]|uniref:pseudouridine synthase n=1 Tax=Rhizobium sp. RU36D TaxID=1907415 RepID=UPI0009D8A0D7|nr:pseudouridine synthase [Rhizobium sp. RU36D]SMD16621.1 23S rRNA pseudouridine2605 synthase [Rhizobium sp. RU36D]